MHFNVKKNCFIKGFSISLQRKQGYQTLNKESHSVRTKKDVEDFLRHFLPKMDVLGIIFLNRSKNQEA